MKTRDEIKSLWVYYNVKLREEHLNEKNNIEIWFENDKNIDLYMNAFLKKCDMKWNQIYKKEKTIRKFALLSRVK